MAEADFTSSHNRATANGVTQECSHTLYGTTATYSDRATTLSELSGAESPCGVAAVKAAQLSALLHMTYGEGSRTFNSMADDLRENLMWLAAGLALDIRVLTELGERME